ncbi:MAG: 2-phospho-L-lactate transferase [Thaumarchaeota archaeon]|nr:2-phospho-L-lactate transferase [Nitrososphaerota archaeon]
MLTVLAGGTGSVKLIRGIAAATQEDLTIISNIGDNFWLHGFYICPDIDIVTYALASILNLDRGWGIKRDTFNALSQIEALGGEAWFKLGDKDLATHVLRTQMLKQGKTLSEITVELCKRLGVKERILPASNEPVETWITTPHGEMHLQEYWVRRKARDKVLGVKYAYAESAKPSPKVLEAILETRAIIMCPANPVTSIGPIFAIKQIRKALSESKAKRLAVSPIIGKAPVSGPAARLMEGIGIEVSPVGVARIYSDLLDFFVVDKSDKSYGNELIRLGVKPLFTNIVMSTRARETRLARFILKALETG